MDRGEKKRSPRNRFKSNCFNYGRKGHHAENCRSAKKEIEKLGDAPADNKGGGRGKCYICGGEKHCVHKYCGLRRSLEHRTRDFVERGADKGAMLAKINVPANAEVGLLGVTTGQARGDGKEEWDSDSGASFHMPHT